MGVMFFSAFVNAFVSSILSKWQRKRIQWLSNGRPSSETDVYTPRSWVGIILIKVSGFFILIRYCNSCGTPHYERSLSLAAKPPTFIDAKLPEQEETVIRERS
jgi:hypothetical protein